MDFALGLVDLLHLTDNATLYLSIVGRKRLVELLVPELSHYVLVDDPNGGGNARLGNLGFAFPASRVLVPTYWADAHPILRRLLYLRPTLLSFWGWHINLAHPLDELALIRRLLYALLDSLDILDIQLETFGRQLLLFFLLDLCLFNLRRLWRGDLLC